MSNPGVPPWGCPWHGLIKGYRLALPNGTSPLFPQPSPFGTWQMGSTSLIQHPGAAEIVRSPDEAAADAAAGRQWWNKAVLAGDTLHGHALGGWIYIDSAGACWLATTTLSELHIEGGLATLTLKRFGVLGGKEEVHAYTFTMPDMGQAEPVLEGSSGLYRVSRYHANKTGSAAVFEVSAEFLGELYSRWRWRPCGWVELELSGPGAACVVTARTVKTRTETLGTASGTPLVLVDDHWYVEEKVGGGTRLTQTPTGATTYYRIVQHFAVSSTESSGYSGYVVGMFYGDSGLRELTLSESAVTPYSSPVAVHTGPTDFAPSVPVTGTWTSTTTFDTSLTVTYAIDGEPVCSYVHSATQSSSQTGVITESGSSLTFSNSADFTPGGSRSDSGSLTWLQDGMGGLGGDYINRLAAADSPELIPRNMGGNRVAYQWSLVGDAKQSVRFSPARHSNALYGLYQAVSNPAPEIAQNLYLPEVATFGGPLTLPALDGGFDFLYGSWCPVTGQAARALEPVCFT